jgi:hypothetical protein
MIMTSLLYFALSIPAVFSPTTLQAGVTETPWRAESCTYAHLGENIYHKGSRREIVFMHGDWVCEDGSSSLRFWIEITDRSGRRRVIPVSWEVWEELRKDYARKAVTEKD